MSEPRELRLIQFDGYEKVRLVKWNTQPKAQLTDKSLFTYNQHGIEKKFKTNDRGKIKALLVNENDLISPGQDLIQYEPCKHTTVIKDMCGACGQDLRQLGECVAMSDCRTTYKFNLQIQSTNSIYNPPK